MPILQSFRLSFSMEPFPIEEFDKLCRLDVDYYCFNECVNDDLFPLLQQLCGQTVVLTNPRVCK